MLRSLAYRRNCRRRLAYNCVAYVLYALPIVLYIVVSPAISLRTHGLSVYGMFALLLLFVALRRNLGLWLQRNSMLMISLILLIVCIVMYNAIKQMLMLSIASTIGSLLSLYALRIADAYKIVIDTDALRDTILTHRDAMRHALRIAI